MPALAQILSTYQLFMAGEDLMERSTDEPEKKQIANTTISEYLDLDLNRKKIPWRRCRDQIIANTADIWNQQLATSPPLLPPHMPLRDSEDATHMVFLEESPPFVSAFLPLSRADRVFFT